MLAKPVVGYILRCMESQHNHTNGNYLKTDDSSRAVSDAFQEVGMDMFQAMNEVAYDMGGDEFANEVVEAAFDSYDIMPNFKALKLLKARDPEAATRVMSRSSEIQKERHQEERDAMFPVRGRLRKLGKALIDANTIMWTGQKPR